MVEATEDWPPGDASFALNQPGNRSILSQRQMRAATVVIVGVLFEDSSKMRLSKRDEVVGALATYRADEPFCKRILPRGSSRNRSVTDPHRAKAPFECLAVSAVAITDQVFRCPIPWKSLGDLPSNPFCGGMRRDIRVQTHKIHQTIAATRQTEARKFLASLSYRVAIRRKSLSRQMPFSMRWRSL